MKICEHLTGPHKPTSASNVLLLLYKFRQMHNLFEKKFQLLLNADQFLMFSFVSFLLFTYR